MENPAFQEIPDLTLPLFDNGNKNRRLLRKNGYAEVKLN